MASKKRRGCVNCGSTDAADAIDNHGRPYKGCAHCRLLSMDQIKQKLATDEINAALRTPHPSSQGEKT